MAMQCLLKARIFSKYGPEPHTSGLAIGNNIILHYTLLVEVTYDDHVSSSGNSCFNASSELCYNIPHFDLE